MGGAHSTEGTNETRPKKQHENKRTNGEKNERYKKLGSCNKHIWNIAQ
jgi:hypothetical protein